MCDLQVITKKMASNIHNINILEFKIMILERRKDINNDDKQLWLSIFNNYLELEKKDFADLSIKIKSIKKKLLESDIEYII